MALSSIGTIITLRECQKERRGIDLTLQYLPIGLKRVLVELEAEHQMHQETLTQ